MDYKFNTEEWNCIKHCLKDYNKGIKYANYGKEPVKGTEAQNYLTGYVKFELVKSILNKLEGAE
mgnify:FL=1|tara:strand:- start:127 stop:318 length:192 start_codon:yes stop_codon:yes gene_type:complete